MKKRVLSKVTKRLFRRGQTGQTIIILAIAFIVLLGFVGLVTDVSLLFVRYNTLRRAVDSAAVAAAGQMRRFIPTTAETNQGIAASPGDPAKAKRLADGYALARNITTLNLAARQFVEFYGLNPSVVLVDTCATLPTDTALECTDTTKLPRKLVRVTAQVDSQTVFLRLLGWRTVKLQASAVSETATMDVVLVFDASESMANQTSYADWEAAGYNAHYYAPRMAQSPSSSFLPAAANGPYDTVANRKYAGDWQKAWVSVLGLTQAQINADTAGFPIVPYLSDASNNVTILSTGDSRNNTRPDCRIRFFPSAASFPPSIPNGSGYSVANDDVRIEYAKVLAAAGAAPSSNTFAANYDGFAPAYNYFGCCNDPNNDGSFADLICQPFLKMRQATESFLDHIDFARGDRVGFVTFDRNAFIIDPDGKKGGPGNGPQDIMITSQPNALDALQKIVGVRAEPSYYADTDNNGLWDAFTLGGGTYDPNNPGTGGGTPFRYDQHMTDVVAGTWTANGAGGFNNVRLGTLNDYPVKDNCRMQNALMAWPFSVYSSPRNQSTATAYGVPYVPMRFPNPLAPLIPANPEAAPPLLVPSPMNPSDVLMNPNLNDPSWDSQMPFAAVLNDAYPRQNQKPYFSYEYAAGCAGSNVGAALRVGNNAFLQANPSRSSGSVWVMVMLGDGAAAGSDPVRRNGATPITANPYGDPNVAPSQVGDYGGLGLCPYGTPNDPSELVDGWEKATPRCMDEDLNNSGIYTPTRHLCFNPKNTDGVNYYIELNDSSTCTNKYDVDDFARDWADFIGLADPFPEVTTAGSSGQRSALQLPVIFTIGFGLDFQQGTHSCADNLDDCLGEELLRYISDVGDNQRLDSDYEQDLKADSFLDWKLTGGDLTYGDRGPCENPVVGYTNADAAAAAGNFGAIVNPMVPKMNCGNYYNAPGGPELERVFDDIASRLFTRLTR